MLEDKVNEQLENEFSDGQDDAENFAVNNEIEIM